MMCENDVMICFVKIFVVFVEIMLCKMNDICIGENVIALCDVMFMSEVMKFIGMGLFVIL